MWIGIRIRNTAKHKMNARDKSQQSPFIILTENFSIWHFFSSQEKGGLLKPSSLFSHEEKS
jgi:hypothetical protein